MSILLGKCKVCKKVSPLISSNLGVCLECIRKRPEEALRVTDEVHAFTRKEYALPPKPPKKGISCSICSNDCRIPEGEKGYCGLVYNKEGQLYRIGGTHEKGLLEWYYDPLPTNCVAEWFCPGCTGAGYPKYAYRCSAEYGYSNLAVFYGACSFDCLFCQNWHYKSLTFKGNPIVSSQYLASQVRANVSCICYFGGDPSVQMPHALKTCQIVLERAKVTGRILRVCWETNGYWKREFALQATKISLESGGIIKVDLKSWDENLNKAFCGVSNTPTLIVFKEIGKFFRERPELPVLTASTLLVPGYVDVEEVRNLAKFISEIDPRIPYSLLAFCPQYILTDLLTTSKEHAFNCYEVAKKYLENVKIENIQLLS
ncbi:MAG: radical SAM protein [Nitrososphaeria archaeon]